MDEAKDDAVREWAGPWLQHWPSGESQSERRRNLRPLFDSGDAASAEASAPTRVEHSPNVDADEALGRALAEIERLRTAVAALETRTPTLTSLERMVDRAVRSSNGIDRSSPRHSPFHLLFFPSASGYRIETREGPAPAVGSTVEVEGARFDVARQGPSPLPGDDRRCVYVLAR
jgi:hypothetical protein